MTLPLDCPPPEREGFWFDCADPALVLERDGRHVRRPAAAAPWIVVDQSVSNIAIGSRWPGQLWRVRVTTLGDMSGLVAQPGYWRAAAIELVEAMPLSALFGPVGDAVLDLLGRVDQLSRGQAEALGNALAPNAWAAYSRAWMRWAGSSEDMRPAQAQAWRGTLAASRRGDKERSPLHGGFLLIHHLLWQRARAIDGDAAFRRIEDDGDIEVVLTPFWRNARDALLYAAMALGAPKYVPEADAAVLTQAWHCVFPPAPERSAPAATP